MRRLWLMVLCSCGFPHGALPSDLDDARRDAIGDGQELDGGLDAPLDSAPPGSIAYVSHTIGTSTSATVTVPGTAIAGATYVLGVSAKSYVPVTMVDGLGATWTLIGDQCGARSQTGTTLYIGRGATSSGNVTVTMSRDTANMIAVLAVYSGSTTNGAVALYNALDATTCDATDMSVDVNSYSFSISATSRVVAMVATRQHAHTPGTGLVQRMQDTHGSSGDTAGIALVDGVVTTVAGSFGTDTDVAAVAVELRP